MQKKIKVLYFTRVGLDAPNNGGAIVCRNHLRRMARDPRLNVTLCNTGSINQAIRTQMFAATIGVPLHFIPFQKNPPRLWPRWPFVPFRKNPPQPRPRWPFSYELHALSQPHIDKAVLDLVNKIEPDVVAIDYLFSALYAPSLFSVPVRKVMITLNRELEFYKDLRKNQRLTPDHSETRLSEFERSIYQQCSAVVALTTRDLPSGIAGKGWVIPSLIDPAHERWSYSGNDRVLFIGNIAHYPNHQAVEWIATQLAPILETMQSKACLQIIGATTYSVPAAWRRPNIAFLGVGDVSLVTKQLVDSDLFIAPIANDFGSKIKLLDCLSHATPFIATDEAMSGVSFLDGVPRMELNQPREAAEKINALLQDRTLLTSISNSLGQQLFKSLKAQEGIWGNLFENILGCDLPPIEGSPP